MGLIDTLILGNAKTPLQADLADAVQRAYLLQSYKDMSSKAASYFQDRYTGKSGLELENLRLDTAMKRRALGIPQDTEEFNQIENDHRPLHILSSLGIAFDKSVQYPKDSLFLKSTRGKYARGINGGASALRRAIGAIG